VLPLIDGDELTLHDADALKHRCASSSSEELEEDISLSSQAMYVFLVFPLLSPLKLAFSLLSLLGHSALICPCSPQP